MRARDGTRCSGRASSRCGRRTSPSTGCARSGGSCGAGTSRSLVLYDRPIAESSRLIHHSDRGVQYLSIRYTERLAAAGIAPSVGSTGDSYDNALAECVIGLYKTEVIRRRGPWRGLADVELAMLTWVAWYNADRLLEPLGYVPPAEFEQAFYDRQRDDAGQLAVLT